MALFLAGLRSVDPDLVKAAQIDGAGPVRMYRRVILPTLWPITVTVVVIQLQFAITRLDVRVVDAVKAEPSTVFDRAGMTVTALGIPHGEVPTLAYRVQTHGVSIVFSSDQTGTNPAFVKFAQQANVLIMHLTIDAGVQHPVHAAPDVVGHIAEEARVGRLIVSHIGPIDLDASYF